MNLPPFVNIFQDSLRSFLRQDSLFKRERKSVPIYTEGVKEMCDLQVERGKGRLVDLYV